MEIISSADNKKIKEIKALTRKKARSENGLFVLEGARAASLARDSGALRYYVFSESRAAKTLPPTDAAYFVVTDRLFAAICDTETPQGVLAVCAAKNARITDMLADDALIVVCEGISDPGNLGTILRTADAAGCSGAILAKGCADAYAPKTARASAGSVLNLPIASGADMSELEILKKHGVQLIAAHLDGRRTPYDIDLTAPTAILIGGEANGLSAEAARAADCLVKLPMRGGAESLNAGVAAAVLLYEAVRQQTLNLPSGR